jgi:hypothetical protein
MATSTLAAIFVPVAVVIGLAVWLGAVFFARRHPDSKQAGPPLRTTVSGGSFRARGGRQLMSRRDATPPEAHDYADGGDGGGGGSR